MKLKVVTSYNNHLYNEYAHRFRETYNWPFKLIVYNEDKDLFDKIPDCKAFVDRNKKRKVKDFWVDGVRFCFKVYAYTHAILNENVDGLICIDADSVFYREINSKWIEENIHRDDCMMTYLGRSNYSECGFLYWNMKHPQTKSYAKFMKDLYDTDHIYNLQEQHDSFIWDYARLRYENEFGIKNHNIGDKQVGHVQARSVLGEIYDHTKGPRKLKGRSPEARV